MFIAGTTVPLHRLFYQLLRQLGMLFLFLALAGAMHHPILTNFSIGYFGGTRGDTGIYLWLLENNASRFFSLPSQGFDIGLFYPYGKALAYTDNFLLPSLLGKLILSAGFPLNIAFNSQYIVAIVLNGYSTYLLARYITGNQLPALFAGISFQFCSFLSSHIGHPQLLFAFFLPLSLLALLRFFDHRTPLSATAIGAAVVGAFLCSVYYAIFAVLLLTLTAVGLAALRQEKSVVPALSRLLLANLPWVALLYWLSIPYQQVKAAFGARRAIELEPFSATILSYIAAPSSNPWWGGISAGISHYECLFFPGVVVLALAGVALSALRNLLSNDVGNSTYSYAVGWLILASILGSASLLCVYGFLVSKNAFLPSPPIINSLVIAPSWLLIIGTSVLLIFRRRSAPRQNGNPPLSIEDHTLLWLFVGTVFLTLSFGIVGKAAQLKDLLPSPFYLMFHLPGFEAIRATGRLGLVVSLVLSLLAAIGLSKSLTLITTTAGTGAALAFATLCLSLVAFELKTEGFPIVGEPPPTGVYYALALRSDQDAVIALPYIFPGNGGGMKYAMTQTEYMRWLQLSNRPSANGYTGKAPPFHQNLDLALSGFPDKKSLKQLGEIVGLRYIIYNPAHQPNFDQPRFEADVASYHQQLELLHHDEAGNYLFRFSPILSGRRFELLLPPNTSSKRRLAFHANPNGLSDGPLAVTFRVTTGIVLDESGKKVPVDTLIPAKLDVEGTGINIELPPSLSPVRAHKVIIRAEGEREKGGHEKGVSEGVQIAQIRLLSDQGK